VAGRRWREKPARRVGNPEGGTNRVGCPGDVDLHADVAEGAMNLKRVVGSLGSRRGRSVSPEEELNSTEAVGAPAPAVRKREDREAVETAWRESRTE
jgi:hypothetical protein